MIKKILPILITLFLISTNSISQDKNLPSVKVKDLKGKSIDFQNIENNGDPIVISFWATWCKPCKKELNAIADIYEDWQEETGVKLVAVSIDDSRSVSKVRPYVNASGWDYDIYIDANKNLARAMGVSTVPHTFLINGNGKIVYEHRGYVDGDEEKLFEQIRKIAK